MKAWLRRWAVRGAVLVAIAAVGGFLVAASGIIPIKASSGHWGVTEWFLQFGKRRSIATHTIGLDLPPLDDPALVLRGAGHFHGGCAPCHGSPALRRPRIAAAMTPAPPDLSEIVRERDPEELFYVVKHGIKFTGMPAWPARGRDDEVRAVVAFLLELPELDADGYLRLVHGDTPSVDETVPLGDLTPPPTVPRAVRDSCGRCHGVDGLGRGAGAFPKLAGQKREYLERALDAYADGRRHSGIMEPVAAGLEPATRRELAAYYSGLRGGRAVTTETIEPPGDVARGEAIAQRGLPDQGVPPCADCHGPAPHDHDAAYPELAGQHAAYLVLQLELFHRNERGGSAYAHLMRQVASRLEPAQMRDVAAYYATLATSEVADGR